MPPAHKLRPYQPQDLGEMQRLYFQAIRLVCVRNYTPEQVEAWAPEKPDLERWRQKLAGEEVVIAELAGEIVGFCSWAATGFLDFLYVHHAHQRQGIASALYRAAESALRAKGLKRLHTEASLTAQPFFARQGFRIVKHQFVQIRGVELPNAVMEKLLV